VLKFKKNNSGARRLKQPHVPDVRSGYRSCVSNNLFIPSVMSAANSLWMLRLTLSFSVHRRWPAIWHRKYGAPTARATRIPQNSLRNVSITGHPFQITWQHIIPLNAKLNSICHLLALLGAHHILHVSRIRVKTRNLHFVNSQRRPKKQLLGGAKHSKDVVMLASWTTQACTV